MDIVPFGGIETWPEGCSRNELVRYIFTLTYNEDSHEQFAKKFISESIINKNHSLTLNTGIHFGKNQQ